jgi:putative endonuclease
VNVVILARTMTDARQELGKIGEELACRELVSRGYAISAKRYRTRHGEIDIVAEDGATVVFVEVKMKSSAECGTAAESVTRWKQRRVVRMAIDYIARHNLHDRPIRFDVVAIDVVCGEPQIAVIPAAFDAV